MDKVLVIICWASLLGILLGGIGIITENFFLNSVFDVSSGLFLLTGGYLLIKNGTFITTKEFRIAILGIPVLLIGVLFKIMHWPSSGKLTGAAFLIIFTSYAIHFIRKNTKGLIDWGKIVFLIMYLLGGFFKLMHWPLGDIFTASAFFLFIVIVVRCIANNRLAMLERKD